MQLLLPLPGRRKRGATHARLCLLAALATTFPSNASCYSNPCVLTTSSPPPRRLSLPRHTSPALRPPCAVGPLRSSHWHSGPYPPLSPTPRPPVSGPPPPLPAQPHCHPEGCGTSVSCTGTAAPIPDLCPHVSGLPPPLSGCPAQPLSHPPGLWALPPGQCALAQQPLTHTADLCALQPFSGRPAQPHSHPAGCGHHGGGQGPVQAAASAAQGKRGRGGMWPTG